ncbi:MAG: tetratricopeptide repeat protein [Promethearchaeota archaeon]|nr:MAG: tetratricopeptide repeat protein [Candidatus Lokiarchaeota archaeon]
MNLICKRCGNEVLITDNFCKYCGAQIARGGGKAPSLHFGPNGVEVESVEMKEFPDGRIQIGDKILEPLEVPLKKFTTEEVFGSFEWHDKALLLSKQGRFNEALEWIDKCIDLDPNAPMDLVLKGGILLELKRYSEAINVLDQALKYGSHIPDVWFVKGMTLSMMGKIDEAVKCYENALEINPKFFPAQQALAVLGRKK